MNAANPEIQWFIARDGKQYGPVSDVEMKKLVELGHMKPGDLVWRPGFPEWRPSAAVFQAPAASAPPQQAPATAPRTQPPQGQYPQQSQPHPQPTQQPQPSHAGQPAPAGPAPRPGAAPGPGPAAGPTANRAAPGGAGAPGMAGMNAGPAPGPGAAPGQGQSPQQWPAMGPATGRPGAGIPVATPAADAPKSIIPQHWPSEPTQPAIAKLPGPGTPTQGAPSAAPMGPLGGGPGTAAQPGRAPQQPAFQPLPGGAPHQATHPSSQQPRTGAPQPGPAGYGPAGYPQPGHTQPGHGQAGSGAQPAMQPNQYPSPQTMQSAAQPAQSAALQPVSHASDLDEETVAPPTGRGGRMAAVAVVVLSLAAIGGFVLSKGGPQQALHSITTFTSTDKGGSSGDAPAGKTAAAAVAAGPVVSEAEIEAGAAALDDKLQHAVMWGLIKKEYPDWYAARMKDGGKLVAEKKPDPAVTKFLIEQLISLRRQNADHALGATTAKLKDIAAAFLANLKALSARSTEACYSFISQGETSATIVELLSTPGQNWPVETQVIAIFEAISEGRKGRTAHTTPVKSDYDVLADQLAKIGWTQADLQLFADPKALARSTPEKVCKMVQDWFTAHISIPDAAVQERLLVETLRPVVAG